MTVRRPTASLLSDGLAFLAPLLLAAYWPLFSTGGSVHSTVLVVRFGLLAVASLLGLLWATASLTRAEFRSSLIICGYLGLLLVPCLLGTNVIRGLHDWVRVLGAGLFGLALARCLRHRSTAKFFSVALAIAAVLSLGFLVFLYFRYAGPHMITYVRLRELKSVVRRETGVALNPLATATLLFGVLSLCLRSFGWVQACSAAGLAIASSLLSGSRAPLALAAMALLAAVCLRWLIRQDAFVRALGITTVSIAGMCILIGARAVDPLKLSEATEGRYDLWSAGMSRFLDHPLIGDGPESWREDIAGRLPGYYELGAEETGMRAGGYHSQFVTLLAEEGLVCFIPALLIWAALLAACCKAVLSPSCPRSQGDAILCAFFLLFFRAFVETPGFFGYGEDVNDYLAMAFLAIVVSRASLLEALPRRDRKRVAAPPSHALNPVQI